MQNISLYIYIIYFYFFMTKMT